MAATTEADFDVEEQGDESILRVKASSNPQSLASAIAHATYDKKKVVLRAIGAGAVNQAVKACAIARGYVAPRGMDISVRPGFTTVQMHDKQDVSAITLLIIVG